MTAQGPRKRERATRGIRGAAELSALLRELEDTTPACADDPRYVAEPDDLLPGDLDAMTETCHGCPLLALCGDYGRRGRPTGGFWAGRHYRASERTPVSAALSPVEDR